LPETLPKNIKILQVNEKNENFTRKTLENVLNYIDNCISYDKKYKKYVKTKVKTYI
jgi:hypothetical protein